MKYYSIYKPLLFGLITGILFSVIDSAIFLYSEKELSDYMKIYLPFLDSNEISIILGATSAAISLLISNYIERYVSGKLELMKDPLLDAIGIIIGVFIVVGLYELYKKYIRHNKKIKKVEDIKSNYLYF